ncbi:MAG: carboxypeptidase regulatory-like domain-containing protein [bacterium]
MSVPGSRGKQMNFLHGFRHPSIRDRLRDESGLTLIEVVVSALLVGLISLSLVGLDAVGSTSADQQRRSQAVEVAQADQERMRAMSADQLQSLSQTRTVTLDGVAFTVTSTGQFLNSASDAGACTATGTANADYARVISRVDWASNRRPDVLATSIITPPRGGSLIAQVVDQNNAVIGGATVTATGTDESTDSIRRQAATDATGCVIFGGLLPGDYSAAAVYNGYVNADGNAAPTNNVTATAGNTSSTKFTIGNPGSATATFTTRINSADVSGQRAPSLAWVNTGMATNGFVNATTLPASVTTPKTLFPFITTGTGVYTDNYTFWAGRCTAAKPPLVANQVTATVAPGTTNAAPVVKVPALDIEVLYRAPSSTTRVNPDAISLTDSCGQTWFPAIRSDATSTSGSLSYPGQPYGASYSICADYNGYREIQSATNTNFSNGTDVSMTIVRNPSNLGTC